MRYSTSRSQVEYSRHCPLRQIEWPTKKIGNNIGFHPPWNVALTRISEPCSVTSSLKSRSIRSNSLREGGMPRNDASTSTDLPPPGWTLIEPNSAFIVRRVAEETGSALRT